MEPPRDTFSLGGTCEKVANGVYRFGRFGFVFLIPPAAQGKRPALAFIALKAQSLWHEIGSLVPYRVHFVVDLFLEWNKFLENSPFLERELFEVEQTQPSSFCPCWTSPWLRGAKIASVQFSRSVVANSLHPVNHSTPGLPVHHQLPAFTQTHVHRVDDTIQPSHPLSIPSPPAPNPSQHQGLFQWVNSLHEVAQSIGVSASASVLPVNTQDWSPLGWTGWIPLPSKGLFKRLLQHHSSKASIL